MGEKEKVLVPDKYAHHGLIIAKKDSPRRGVRLRSLVSPCVQLSLCRMTSFEYIRNKNMKRSVLSCTVWRKNLKLYQGRVWAWHTGTKSKLLKNAPMGRNMVWRVPHELATRLGLPDPDLFTFHSFRRTSATSAADGGSSTAQITYFFGWKNVSMCQEYVSSSKPAIKSMATWRASLLPTWTSLI